MSRSIDPRNIEVVDDQMAAVFRAKSPAERLAIAHGMWRSASRMITSMVQDQNPEWADDRVRREVARRISHGSG
ncbi:MAG: hypothetical protein WD669_04490 [Pirellulales bacterium]